MSLLSRHSAPLDWYETEDAHDEIADVIAWLADTGQLGGVDEAIHVCRKPWHYSAEREQMIRERRRVA